MRRLLRFIVLIAVAAPVASAESGPPDPSADLRLEWRDPASAVDGVAGSTVELPYRLRNVGGRDAFAVVLKTHTSLGAPQQPERVQPGPKAGATMERTISLPLATGMREVCVEAMLQTLAADEPTDPTLKDNRICRPVRVREPQRKGNGR
jgi:hypothetical protein